jgi:hypothetical protein
MRKRTPPKSAAANQKFPTVLSSLSTVAIKTSAHRTIPTSSLPLCEIVNVLNTTHLTLTQSITHSHEYSIHLVLINCCTIIPPAKLLKMRPLISHTGR